MYTFADFYVFCCLFTAGFFYGYYCKYAYIYENLWKHWYAILGITIVLAMSFLWTLKKYNQKQYSYNHFYIMIYGFMCFIISACFMLTENMEISFYFGFIGLGTITIPAYSFISLRSSAKGLRPARIALGNCIYFIGLTTGFAVFNEFEPRRCGWTYLGVTLTMILGAVINEVLQHLGVHNYKASCDRVFNLMNEEKIVFLRSKSIYAFFTGRPEFFFARNRQYWVMAISVAVVLERVFIYSTSFLQLSWSSTVAYVGTQHLYGALLLYTIGCGVGCVLLVRYKPKLVYLLFGLLKITITAAILGIYAEDEPEQCFIFLCFYYIAMGVYSSIAFQMILECTQFLCAEFCLAVAFALELFIMEMFKYETKADDSWTILIGTGICSIIATAICIVFVQLFLPHSEGLIDMRNRLLGVRRHRPIVQQTKIWSSNYFLHHDLQPSDVINVKFDGGNRVFQQYPRESSTTVYNGS